MSDFNTVITEPYEGSEPFCFISYAHYDKSMVYPILHTLSDAGIRLWYDKGLNLGDPYHEIILDRIEKCSCFIVFFSETAVDINRSEFITNEVGQARKYNKQILPVYLNKIVDLPAKLIFNGVADLHSHILECSKPDSVSTVIGELLENIPSQCKTSRYNRIPYDEETIDTTLRRHPIILINDTSTYSFTAQLTDEINTGLQTIFSSLASSEIAHDSVDIAVVSTCGTEPIINVDLTPLSLFICPTISCVGAGSVRNAIDLVFDMMANCITFYSDIGVSSNIPVIILISDFASDAAHYSLLSDNSSEVCINTFVVPIGESAVPEHLSNSVIAPGETSLTDAFSLLTDKICNHIGCARIKASMQVVEDDCVDTDQQSSHMFRQRRLSQILKGK